MGHHPTLRATRLAFALRSIALAMPAAAGLIAASATHAQSAATQRYDIPAGPLTATLNRFGVEAGIMLSLFTADTSGKQSPGVQGEMSVAQALAALLAGTGLDAVPRAGGGYLVRVTPVVGAATALSEVRVIAQAEQGGATEGTGSYRALGRSATGTPLALGAKETPQSVTVFTRQRLDDQNVQTVNEALEFTTGVTAFRQGVGTDLEGIWSRGFAVSNYLLDGVPSAAAGSMQNTVMYDRIEVLRGANGLMSGMGNPSASINMVRKRPTAERQISVSAEAGSWDRYGAGADISTPLNDSASVRGRLVLDTKRQNSWIDRYQKKSDVVYGIVEMDLSPSTLLTAGFSAQSDRNDASMRTGLPLTYSNGVATHFARSTNIGPNWAYHAPDVSSVFASLAHDFGQGWRAKLDYAHLRSDYDSALYFLTGSIDQSTGLGGALWPVRWKSDDRLNTVDAQLSGPFSLLGRAHEVVAGVSLSQLRRDTSDYGGWMGPWTGYDGTIGNLHDWDGSANVPTFVKASDTVTQENQLSAYATARWSLGESTRLITGARVIDWKRVADNTTVVGAASRTELRERGVVVPYAGLVHALDDRWSLYGNYTQVFQPQAASVRDVNNRPLEPEQGTSYEAGVKADWLGGKLMTSLALFRSKQQNLAIYNAGTDAYDALQGITTRGLELEAAGEPAPGWNLSAGYAYTSSKDADGARANTPIPRHGLKLFTTYRLRGELHPFTVGGGVNWQSEYGYVGEPAQKSYAVVNLMARYAVSRQLSVSLHLNNVFDKTYYSGLSNYGAMYGAPRNVMAAMKYTF
ncbi:MAG: TonB-dependent siderophore receptor [Comamonas sp.]